VRIFHRRKFSSTHKYLVPLTSSHVDLARAPKGLYACQISSQAPQSRNIAELGFGPGGEALAAASAEMEIAMSMQRRFHAARSNPASASELSILADYSHRQNRGYPIATRDDIYREDARKAKLPSEIGSATNSVENMLSALTRHKQQAAKDAYVSFATRESVQPRGFAAAMNSVQQPQYNPFVQNVGHTQPVIPVDATPWTKMNTSVNLARDASWKL